MTTDYATDVATSLHHVLNDLADKLAEIPERRLTTEDLRDTLLQIAEAIPAPRD